MATVAADPFFTPGGPANRYANYSPGVYAQGADGRFLERHACTVIMRRGQSQYVSRLLGGERHLVSADRSALVGALSGVGCAGLVLAGLGSGLGDVFYPLAAIAGFAAYAFFARWVAKQNRRSGFLGAAERVRRALAYQDDVTPRTK